MAKTKVSNVGRGNGLIPWDKFIGPNAYYAANEKAAFQDLYGSCRDPISIYFNHLTRTHTHDAYDGLQKFALFEDEQKVLVRRVPCRKCPPCRRSMSRDWAERGIAEFNAAPRTWFGTLTISEEFLEGRWAQDRNEVIRSLYENYSEDEVLAYTMSELPPLHSVARRRVEAYFVDIEIAKFFKRLRYEKHKLRYVCTTEFGTRTGRLHYHALIHCGQSLRQADLERNWDGWSIGQSRFRLCKTNTAAHYVAKYVAKDGGAYRVKASQHYGSAEKAIACWRPLSVLEAASRPVTTSVIDAP